MPSEYIKKGYGELSKDAEDRIRDDLTIICKQCNHILNYYRTELGDGYYKCTNCFRIVTLQDYK
jgi:hypothetical protein